MKIGIVCYPTFGGSGVVATELGLEMAARGHQVHFISYSQPVRLDPYVENVYYHEVVVADYPLFQYTPYELVLTSKLVSVAKNERLDLLHVHYAIPHASAACLAKKILAAQGIYLPIVCTLHGTDITLVGRDPSFEPVITYAMDESDAVTAVSESLKRDTLSYFQTKADIRVIPNFINPDRYSNLRDEHLRTRLAPHGEPILVHVSNFRKVKRVGDVVQTFSGIRSKISAKLLLIGDGPEHNSIELMCRALECRSDIHFLGNVRDVERFLANGDLFLLPSETESFGLAALEAMAAGMPVISSNTGGLPEVNENGFSGYLCPVGDVTNMVERGLEILKSPESLSRFKTQARAQADKFTIEKVLPSYVDMYEKLILPLVKA